MKKNIIDTFTGLSTLDKDYKDLIHSLRSTLVSEKEIKLFNNLEKKISQDLYVFNILYMALNNSAAIAITDPQGVILFVNDLFCKFSKYNKEEVIGRKHDIIRSDFHDKEFFKNMWETILSGSVWAGIIKNRAKDGTHYWMKSTIVPIFDNNGNIEYFIAIRTDITESAEEKEMAQIDLEEFSTSLDLVNQLVFRVEKTDGGDYYFKSVKGKLIEELELIESQVINITFNTLLPKKLFKKVSTAVGYVFEEKRGTTIQVILKSKKLLISMNPQIRNGEVACVIGTTTDVTAISDAKQRIYKLAFFDEITNLPNRKKLVDVLREYIYQLSIMKKKLAVVYIDLDRFKIINDTFSTAFGDDLLTKVGHRIYALGKGEYQVFRAGGDEFVVLIKDIEDEKKTLQLVKKIQQAIEKPFLIQGHEVLTSASIGISIFPQAGNTPEELIKNSTLAMHLSKERGRNQLHFFTERLMKEHSEAAEIERKLRKAIKRNELLLHYQPKVNAYTGDVIGVEALVRWKNGDQLVSPAKFIPIAEESGLIVPLGEWVLHHACLQAKDWVVRGLEPAKVSVNVSALELQTPNFVKKVANILKTVGLDAQYLELEITENGLVWDSDRMIVTLNQLRDIGVALSIDDFGTGYSSFSYLQKFPVNYLKIDQSFVRGLESDESQAAIVRAMIYVGHSFKMQIIAEGVEELETFNFLKLLKCDYIQGYHVSRPLPPQEIERIFLKEGVLP